MLTEPQEQQLYDAIFSGRKLEAIKLHRQFTGSGLKEAKDFIDSLEAELYAESPGKFIRKPGRGCTVSAGCFMLCAAIVTLVLL